MDAEKDPVRFIRATMLLAPHFALLALVEDHLTATKVAHAGTVRGLFSLVVALDVIVRVDSQRMTGRPGVE